MQKIIKGDQVIVIAGKDKGKQGKVLAMVDKGERLLIEGINLAKKHVKPNPNAGIQGGIVAKPMPIHRSNVQVYDPIAKKGSRMGIRELADGKRVRYFKSSDQVVEVKSNV